MLASMYLERSFNEHLHNDHGRVGHTPVSHDRNCISPTDDVVTCAGMSHLPEFRVLEGIRNHSYWRRWFTANPLGGETDKES